MGNRLKAEIKQNKPFLNLQQEALLNIHRTSGQIFHLFQQTLKSYGLTEPQFNVLRILRGAGPEGLRCSEIGERMLTRDPDITRLLGRLEVQGHIERKRDARDRRVVFTHITGEGLKTLASLDPVVAEATKTLLGHLSDEKLSTLIDLLEEVRQGLTD